MRTQEEIKIQIEGLENEKQTLPKYSSFGDPTHAIIEAQISILDGSNDLTDFDDGNWEEMDEDHKIYCGAEDAYNWLQGYSDYDLFG